MNSKELVAVAAFAATLAGAANAQNLETLASSREYRAEEALDVNVRFGMGTFTLTRDQGTALYRASVVYDKRFDPVLDYSSDSHSLDVGIATRESQRGNLRNIKGQRIDLSISPAVPMNFHFAFGAGKAEIDLGGLALARADLKTGASETTVVFSRPTVQPCEYFSVEVGAAKLHIEGLGNSNCAEIDIEGAAGSLLLDFTGEWQHEGVTEANIKIGLGGLTLRFPSNLGVSMSVERFVASFDRDGFRRDGDRYVSTNYDNARAQLHLDLHTVFGDIDVEWVPGR